MADANPPGADRRAHPVLSHLDRSGRAQMVNVTGKAVTARRAVARCRVASGLEPLPVLAWDELFATARVAGVQAAKQTAALIPLCHPLAVGRVDVRFSFGGHEIELEAEAEVLGQTGVEMEALTACATAALSLVGALFAAEVPAVIEDLALWEKSGGRSGNWMRPDASS